MPSVPDLDMLERPRKTIQAAEQFHRNAAAIAHACVEAGDGEVVVAVVEREGMSFVGCWIVPREEIPVQVARLDRGDWSLLFSPGADRDEVEERALQIARLAFRRWEVALRWMARTG
jgi:hypothetical protein